MARGGGRCEEEVKGMADWAKTTMTLGGGRGNIGGVEDDSVGETCIEEGREEFDKMTHM